MNIEYMWTDIMKMRHTLEKRETYKAHTKSSIKRVQEENIKIKNELVHYAKVLFNNDQINEEINNYEEFKNSKSIIEWLTNNAPKGYVLGKDDLFTHENTLPAKIRAEREYKIKRRMIPDDYIKNFTRSSGYENVGEFKDKELKAIAKRFNVEVCVVREKVKDYFTIENSRNANMSNKEEKTK